MLFIAGLAGATAIAMLIFALIGAGEEGINIGFLMGVVVFGLTSVGFFLLSLIPRKTAGAPQNSEVDTVELDDLERREASLRRHPEAVESQPNSPQVH